MPAPGQRGSSAANKVGELGVNRDRRIALGGGAAWLGAFTDHQQDDAEQHQDSDEKRLCPEPEANP